MGGDGLGCGGRTVSSAASGTGGAAARILHGPGTRVRIVDLQEPVVEHDGFHRRDRSDLPQARAGAAIGAAARTGGKAA